MKSSDVVELRIRRNQKSDAGKLIKFLMDYEANQAVNPAGDNATKLALKTLRLFFMPYVLEACFGGSWRSLFLRGNVRFGVSNNCRIISGGWYDILSWISRRWRSAHRRRSPPSPSQLLF